MNKRIRKKINKRFDHIIQELNVYALMQGTSRHLLWQCRTLPPIDEQAIRRVKRNMRRDRGRRNQM